MSLGRLGSNCKDIKAIEEEKEEEEEEEKEEEKEKEEECRL
jgi:hypothetical protein